MIIRTTLSVNSNTELISSIIELADNGTVETETEAFAKQLSKYHIENNKIVGFCFDIISVNTYIVNGTITRLQQYLKQRIS